MESSAESVADINHELEIAEAIRNEILTECTEIQDMIDSHMSSLSKSLAQGINPEELELARGKTLAATAKTTPKMMTMSEIMYNLKKTDIVAPSS